jgi:hypothetical protein
VRSVLSFVSLFLGARDLVALALALAVVTAVATGLVDVRPDDSAVPLPPATRDVPAKASAPDDGSNDAALGVSAGRAPSVGEDAAFAEHVCQAQRLDAQSRNQTSDTSMALDKLEAVLRSDPRITEDAIELADCGSASVP